MIQYISDEGPRRENLQITFLFTFWQRRYLRADIYLTHGWTKETSSVSGGLFKYCENPTMVTDKRENCNVQWSIAWHMLRTGAEGGGVRAFDRKDSQSVIGSSRSTS